MTVTTNYLVTGNGITGSTANAVQALVSGDGVIVGAAKLRKMLGAIGRSAFTRVNIGYHSHSIGYGVDCLDSGVYDAASTAQYFTKSQGAIIATLLSAAYGGTSSHAGIGMGGTGNAANPLITMGGGASAPSNSSAFYGPSGWNATLSSAAHTLSFACVGSSVKVWAAASGASIAARWNAASVSAGATQTATLPSASDNPGTDPAGTRHWYEFVISGLTPGETVTLMAPTSGSYRVYYIDADYQASAAGVTVHRLSRPGTMLAGLHGAAIDATDTGGPNAGWIGADNSAGGLLRLGQAQSMSVRVPQSGVILQTDVNDMNAWGGGYNYTLTDHQRHLASYLAYHATLQLPVLVVLGPLRSPTLNNASIPYTQDELIAALKQTIEAASMAGYIDLTTEWPGATTQARYDAQAASGLMYDTTHPGSIGHGYYGSWIGRALLSAASSAARMA